MKIDEKLSGLISSACKGKSDKEVYQMYGVIDEIAIRSTSPAPVVKQSRLNRVRKRVAVILHRIKGVVVQRWHKLTTYNISTDINVDKYRRGKE